MSAASIQTARRNRWAISFADLLLLLLGFFVVLQSAGSRRDAMLSKVSQQFGGRAMARSLELRASQLFAPGEAMLTPQGRSRISGAARSLHDGGKGIEIRSEGTDRARHRFDDWDLAAARLGAVARGLQDEGIAQDRLHIRGLDQEDGRSGQGQVIRMAPAR